MSTKTLDASIKDAISFLQTCPYKATAIKIELEAQLNRRDVDCYECENGDIRCDDCDGEGIDAYDDRCESCDGEGRFTCDYCVRSSDGTYNFGNNESCKEYILDHVSQQARNKLVFSKFYNDGSVDSEFTFTLMLENVEFALEFIEAFKKLASANGGDLDTRGAGMHIAILNSSDGNYPAGGKLYKQHFDNFTNSINHLMPALLFLGSCDFNSRGLGYRHPQVSLDKYSAIHGAERGGAIEFRVFETCYQNPIAIYDYICVIAKCMKFYTKEPVNLNWFGSIGKIAVPNHGHGVGRFYYSTKHLEALDRTLGVIKPDHKTIKQIKNERSFKINKSKLLKDEAKHRARWQAEYYQRKKDLVAQKAKIAKLKIEWGHYYDVNDYLRASHPTKESFIQDQLESNGYVLKERQVSTYINKKHQDWIGGGQQQHYPFEARFILTV